MLAIRALGSRGPLLPPASRFATEQSRGARVYSSQSQEQPEPSQKKQPHWGKVALGVSGVWLAIIWAVECDVENRKIIGLKKPEDLSYRNFLNVRRTPPSDQDDDE